MSPPTRQFHRLSIEDMPDDRAQTSRTVRGAGRPNASDNEEGEDSSSAESPSGGEASDEGDEGEGNEGSSDGSAGESTVRAPSGTTYDLRHLDAESEARALVGLTGQFGVADCRALESGYEFQLLDRPPRVHIGSGSPTCTCSTFQGRPGLACHHIFVSVLREWMAV